MKFQPFTYPFQENLSTIIRCTAERLHERGERIPPAHALYAEKPGGFQCQTCRYVTPVNATHGRCTAVEGTVHLTEGACVLWDANPDLLHLYREPS